ncbi:MAG: RHS repeat-associated core domain-containing protein [Clostridiales bacterium]|nr:RHS repeat-associated core domain-containing protein [Clostridiales bacterium]
MLDGIYVIAEIKDGDVTNYIRGVTGIIYSKDKKGTKTYYVTNNHGDVTALVNSSGNIIKEYTYDEYGVETNPDKEDTNPFRYCGEYYDTETGFIYLRARYYDPELGRFVSPDSHWTPDNMIYGDDHDGEYAEIDILAIRQSNNLYVYCIGNPMNFFDLTGFEVDDSVLTKDDAIKITLLGEIYNWAKKNKNSEFMDATHYQAAMIRSSKRYENYEGYGPIRFESPKVGLLLTKNKGYNDNYNYTTDKAAYTNYNFRFLSPLSESEAELESKRVLNDFTSSGASSIFSPNVDVVANILGLILSANSFESAKAGDRIVYVEK